MRRYSIEPRWRYGVSLAFWLIVIVGYIGQQISMGSIGGTGSVRVGGVLGLIIGGVLVYILFIVLPARKGLKLHPACEDVSEVVIAENAVSLKVYGGKELTVDSVRGADLNKRGKVRFKNKLVFMGTLEGRRTERIIFRENLTGRTYRALAQDVAKQLSHRASGS